MRQMREAGGFYTFHAVTSAFYENSIAAAALNKHKK